MKRNASRARSQMRPTPQWRKWRRCVKTIVAPASSTAAITSSSRFEPPGWIDRGHARAQRQLRAVGEGEESVRGQRPRRSTACPCSRAFSTAIRTESTRLIWPAPIPSVCRSLREHDRVRGHVLAHPPGEKEIAPERLAHRAADDVHAGRGPRCPSPGPGRADRRERACSRARRPRRAGARGRRGSG